MTDIRTAIDDAASWHACLDSPEMDWEAFGAWLDADPSHRRAYDSIALLDAEIGEAAPAIAAAMPANDDMVAETPAPTRSPRWRWAALGSGGALAAGLAVLLAVPSADTAGQLYTTGRGETQAVTLADGSRMQIDRGSRVSVSGGTSPVIEIADGAASFAVRHDPSRLLIVRAGGYEIRDIGTRFDVVSARARSGHRRGGCG
ncbi:FecR family protein [Sphingomonas sp. LR55]|uniref:FecR family protein n=1 Tax=Sphingomonas sp. LR55 TaxID=3050231 RepID=UPI002FE1666F